MLVFGRSLLWIASFLVMAVRHAAAGLFQAHHPIFTYRHLMGEAAWRGSVLKCLAVDVVIYRGALFVYESLLPRLCEALLGVRLGASYELAVVICWSIPAYAVCEVVTTVIHIKMAKGLSSFSPPREREGTQSAGAGTQVAPAGGGAIMGIAGLVYTRIIYVFFCVQLKVLCSLPLVGTALTLVLSALLHAYDCFEFVWDSQGIGVADRFALIENHWLYFLGYGGVLASFSLRLRFFDLFVLRAVLYPLYIANAPHALFAHRSCQPLPVFHVPLGVFNAILELATVRLGIGGRRPWQPSGASGIAA